MSNTESPPPAPSTSTPDRKPPAGLIYLPNCLPTWADGLVEIIHFGRIQAAAAMRTLPISGRRSAAFVGGVRSIRAAVAMMIRDLQGLDEILAAEEHRRKPDPTNLPAEFELCVGGYRFMVCPEAPRSIQSDRVELLESQKVPGHLHLCVMDQTGGATETRASLFVADDDARRLTAALCHYFNREPGDMRNATAVAIEHAETVVDLEMVLDELRCPECGEAPQLIGPDQRDGECDSPVCLRPRNLTLAEAYHAAVEALDLAIETIDTNSTQEIAGFLRSITDKLTKAAELVADLSTPASAYLCNIAEKASVFAAQLERLEELKADEDGGEA